jgi:hypothetical protein
MKAGFLVAATLMMVGNVALAQTACPQGVAAGGAQCGPSSLIDDAGSNDYGSDIKSLPQIRWIDSWGAIAGDGVSTYGVATDLPSKRKARKAAIDECRNRGGGSCQLDRAFVNQCAAIIAGETMSATANAPTEKEAVDMGMQTCSQEGGTNCHVYWSGCSLAKRGQ